MSDVARFDLSRFLRRWSRMKRAAAHPPPPAPLPPLAELDADADLTAYLRQEAGEALRRQALRKIFSDPRLNVMDGLDTYIDDYSVADPIPAQMLAQMNQARAWFGDDTTKEDGVAAAIEPTPQQVADATRPSNEEDRHQT